jgi:hypothetical protein
MMTAVANHGCLRHVPRATARGLPAAMSLAAVPERRKIVQRALG